jgi:hypothetical protein
MYVTPNTKAINLIRAATGAEGKWVTAAEIAGLDSLGGEQLGVRLTRRKELEASVPGIGNIAGAFLCSTLIIAPGKEGRFSFINPRHALPNALVISAGLEWKEAPNRWSRGGIHRSLARYVIGGAGVLDDFCYAGVSPAGLQMEYGQEVPPVAPERPSPLLATAHRRSHHNDVITTFQEKYPELMLLSDTDQGIIVPDEIPQLAAWLAQPYLEMHTSAREA